SLKILRAVTLALAAWFVALLVYVLARRFVYPYDLEWMEGGMIAHALRLAHHQPIYAPPSVDFIPYLYTPGYPWLLFVLGHVFPLGYELARFVSIASFLAVALLGYVYARREGGSRAAAFCAVALMFAAFVPTGAFYDLARPDSLFMALVTAGLFVAWWQRKSYAGGVAAALLLVAAFFVKQTAAPFMVALGLALLLAEPRVAVVYGLTLAVVGLPSLWLANHTSNGWFWTYTSVLHRKHDFFPARAFLGTPGRLALILGPSLLLVPWALARRRTPGLVYATFIALAGIVAACTSFGTQWAFTNAFMPGVMLPAIAIGVAAGRLLDDTRDTPPRLRPAAVYLLLALSLLTAPGGLNPIAARFLPESWGLNALKNPTGYDPRIFIPTARDRAAGDELIARLRAANGDVLIPFHPFYAELAGKRTYLHRMGVLDIWRAGMGAPLGLAEALDAHRFALVIMDDKIDGNWQLWPRLQIEYRMAGTIAGPRVVSGSPTEPRYVMVPNVIDKELQ
ncbi:MAG: glycosyltransferase family 39 protein, partial [Myxococcales bacterium]|nr:glycosyltransferase family 39 protein [Myxococcales bacterium]